MPWVLTDSPIVAIPKIQKIPKADKTAMTLDMSSDKYKWALNNPMDFMRNQMKTDLLYLLNQGLGFKDIDPGGRVPYQNKIADAYTSSNSRVLILVPREHFKSTYTQGYIVQELLKNPNKTFTVRCNTSRNAFYFVDVIKKRIKNQDIFILFGDLEGSRWSGEAIDFATREMSQATRDPNVLATGLGTDVTSLHPDEGIFDDVVSQSNFDTEEGRQKVKKDYKDMISVVKSRNIVNGTRWDELDLYGDLIEQNKSLPPDHRKKYHILLMSVYGEANDKMETPEKGVPLFPHTYRNGKSEKIETVIKDQDWIDDKRFELGAYIFSLQYLNNPIPTHNQVFRKGDFNLWEDSKEKMELLKTCVFYLTLDCAGSREKYSDYTAFIVCGVTPLYHIFVVEAKQEKIDLSNTKKTIDYIFKYAKKWEIKRVGIEQGIYERLYRKPVKDRQWLENNHAFTFKRLKYGEQPGAAGNKKAQRIASLQPYFENGVFHIKKKLFDLQMQLLKWRPYKTSHDDLVDALAYQLQLIPRYIQKEIKHTAKDYFFKSLEKKRKWNKEGNNAFDVKYINEEVFRG